MAGDVELSLVDDDSLVADARDIEKGAKFVASIVVDWLVTHHRVPDAPAGEYRVEFPPAMKGRLETVLDTCKVIELAGATLARELPLLEQQMRDDEKRVKRGAK